MKLPDDFVRAVLDRTPVSIGPRRTASPHEFYRYPARFSPRFAASAIAAFSEQGDLVVDPFVGGGTTVVEAIRRGRRAIGSDLNPLATFVTRVKTTPLTKNDVDEIRAWISGLNSQLRITRSVSDFADWAAEGYFKDLESPDTWRIRKLLGLAISSVPRATPVVEGFCRCVLLRSAQWALDMRGTVPGVPEFRRAIIDHGTAMVETMLAFSGEIRGQPTPSVLDVGLPGLADRLSGFGRIAPRLVLTSPPYPRVYVNYHRWKLRGRREIPVPFWIADRRDGHGLAHYTMSARAQATLDSYFFQLNAAFRDLARVLQPESLVIQLVGFNDPSAQLLRFLGAMNDAGYTEVSIGESGLSTYDDGRLWRSVPGRRWWTEAGIRQDAAPHTSREVVLFHQLK